MHASRSGSMLPPETTQTILPLSEPEGRLEDATMTEVGTKLDLARAYADMGDPDGARSILAEVIDEGDESEKQQANEMLAGLGN